MFSDPQSVTITGVANSLPRIPSATANSGQFRKDDGLVSLTVSHSKKGKINRHLVQLNLSKIAADPLMAGVNIKADQRCYLVIENPDTGFTSTEVLALTKALIAWSSDANITKVIGGEA